MMKMSSTYIVAVQHGEELWMCDEFDSRGLEEMSDFLLIDRGGGTWKNRMMISQSHLRIVELFDLSQRAHRKKLELIETQCKNFINSNVINFHSMDRQRSMILITLTRSESCD